MNKFALTTVAALPGSGGGASAWQSPEVVRKEARPATCEEAAHHALHDAFYMEKGKVSPPLTALEVKSHMEDAIKRAEWKRNNHAMLYGNQRAARIAALEDRLANPLSFADYEAAWKEIESDPELSEYWAHRN